MVQVRQYLQSILLLSFLLPVTFEVGSQAPVIQVIVNSSVESEKMSVAQIRRIFSMRQTTWSDNYPITVYVLTNQHETHQAFSTSVLGMFPYQLERIWNKLVYSGLGEEPIKVQSEQEMLDRVSQKNGAIGYIMQTGSLKKVKRIEIFKE